MDMHLNSKLIAIMDIVEKNGRCSSVGCRHKLTWPEGAEQDEVCKDCLEAVKSGKELRAVMYEESGEIIVILGGNHDQTTNPNRHVAVVDARNKTCGCNGAGPTNRGLEEHGNHTIQPTSGNDVGNRPNSRKNRGIKKNSRK